MLYYSVTLQLLNSLLHIQLTVSSVIINLIQRNLLSAEKTMMNMRTSVLLQDLTMLKNFKTFLTICPIIFIGYAYLVGNTFGLSA